MGDHHIHITSVIMDDPERIDAFERAASEHFRTVARVWPAVLAFATKDTDGVSSELEMPDICEALAGILKHDIEIVSAWEPFSGGTRERCLRWVVRGFSDQLRIPLGDDHPQAPL